MQKISKVIGVIVMVVFGLVAMGYAAGGAYEDIIDKIKIKSINKIEVKDNNVLDVTVKFENLNDKKIKFVNGENFTFSVGTWEKSLANKKTDKCSSSWDEGKIVDDVKEIGKEERFEEKPELDKRKGIAGTGITFITFHIKMEDPKALESMKHLIHCIGDPANKQPFFPIKGKFELAIYSDAKRGWTTARDLAIEWKFVPCIQDKVDFMSGN